MNELKKTQQSEDTARKKIRKTGLYFAIYILCAGLCEVLDITNTLFLSYQYFYWREALYIAFWPPLGVILATEGIISMSHKSRLTDHRPTLYLYIIGCTLLCVSMGAHEPVANLPQLHPKAALIMLHFIKNIFSHTTFFAGFIIFSLSVMLVQYHNPFETKLGTIDFFILIIATVIGAAGIFFSLIHGGDIRIDVAVITAVILSCEILRKGRSMHKVPIIVGIEAVCGLGMISLLLARPIF